MANIPFLRYPAVHIIHYLSRVSAHQENIVNIHYILTVFGAPPTTGFCFAGVFRVFRAGRKLIRAVNFQAG